MSTPTPLTPERWYRTDELRDAGVPFCKHYIRQLVREGKFPRPFKVGRVNAWAASTIAKWQHDVIAKQPRPKASGREAA